MLTDTRPTLFLSYTHLLQSISRYDGALQALAPSILQFYTNLK